MNFLPGRSDLRSWMAAAALTPLTAALLVAVTPTNTKSYPAGEKAKANGVIISHDGDTLNIRGDDEAIETIDLTSTTKIQLKHGVFGRKAAMTRENWLPKR
jgi:hypothetical protein